MLILNRQVSITLIILIISSVAIGFNPELSVFFALYSLNLLLVGNQWRFVLFKENSVIRKINIFFPLSVLCLLLIASEDKNIFSFDYDIIALSLLVSLIAFSYQVYRQYSFIKHPQLAHLTLSGKSKAYIKQQTWLGIGCAIAEELLFRGVLYILIGHEIALYIVISTFMFVLWHHLTPWSEGLQSKENAIHQVVFSVIVTILVSYSGSIIPAILSHVFFNLGNSIRSLIVMFEYGVKND